MYRIKYLLLLLLVILSACSPMGIVKNTPTLLYPYNQSGNWTLAFSDEFEGTIVDLNKWRPNWLGGSDTTITPPINTLELNCYNPRDVSVSGGVLMITAKNSTLGSSCKIRSGGIAPYESGMLQSNGHFNTAYGYFEAKIWMPSGIDHKSVWPAFWTDGQSWPTTGEIDIVECYGTDASCSFHYHYSGGGPGGNFTIVGSTTGWHIYAVNWQPGKVEWFWDGAKVWEYTTGIISSPHYIILNLGVIGTQAILPATMLVDYVRVWKSVTPITPLPATVTRTPTITKTPTITPTWEIATIVTDTPPATFTSTPTVTPTGYRIFANGTPVPCSKPCRIDIP